MLWGVSLWQKLKTEFTTHFAPLLSNKQWRGFLFSLRMEADNFMEHITETKIGNTRYIVTAECSPNATETIEQKLERIILRNVADTKKYQNKEPVSVAMCGNLWPTTDGE